MEGIYAREKIPVIVGGTGFYIQAVTNAIDFTESEADAALREELFDFAREHGAAALHKKLEMVDSVAAAQIHENNIKRVVRALEYYAQTKKPISEHNEEQTKRTSPYELYYFVLTAPRALLYEAINRRVDQMMTDGFLDEVKHLKAQGVTRGMLSMQGLGYKELFAYLDGEITLENAKELIKRDTRHFAKRQLTWFKRERGVIWVDKSKYQFDEAKILDAMLALLPKKG